MAIIHNATNVVAGQHITAVPPSLGVQEEVSLHESNVRGMVMMDHPSVGPT